MYPIDHLAAEFEVIQPMAHQLPKIVKPSSDNTLKTALILLAIGAVLVYVVHKNDEKKEESK